MVSVTSETSASLSFQGASQRSARPDPRQQAGNDKFAALVDSNAASSNDNSRYDTQPPPPRRSDDAPAASARDGATGPDRTSRASGPSRDDKNVDGDTPRRSKPKSKSDAATADGTQSSGDKPSAAPANPQDPSNPAAANAVPAATAVLQADAAATGAPSDTPAAPLAIAAAAIAASSAIAGSGAPGGADTANATAIGGNAGNVAKAAGVKTETQLITTADTATAQGAATATGDVAFAATVAAAARPAKPATQANVQPAAKDAVAAAPADQDGAAQSGNATSTGATNIVAAVTPPTAIAGKAQPDGITDTIKADNAGNAPTPSVGGHSGAQTLLATADASAQAANAIQPQLPTAQTTPSATAQLTVSNAAQQSAAVPLGGLAMQIVASAKSGKSRFEIRLDPAELGRIDVRIDVDRNGQVTSHLTVERPETLSMLRQDANQLQRALDNAGLSTGNGGLQFSLRDQSQSGQNNNGQPGPNAHHLIVNDEDSAPAAMAGRSYGRTAGALGGVDIRV